MNIRLLIAALIITACSRESVQFDMSGQAAGGQVSYVGPVLAAAKREFFGPGDPGDNGGPGGGTGDFGLDETVRVQGAPPAVLALGITRRDAVGPGLALRSSLSVAAGGIRVYLPDGMGVLTDPMRVNVAAQEVRAQVALGRTVVLSRGWQVEYEAGVGMQSVTARAHMRSALIDLVSHATVTQPYGVLSGRALSDRGLGLLGTVLVYPEGAAEYRLGVVQRF